MAGNYPNAPSWRMAYDRDGTVMCSVSEGVTIQRSSAEMVLLNDESESALGLDQGNAKLVFLFPEARDLDGYTVFGNGGVGVIAEVSKNTTNGLDGSWTSIGDPPARDTPAVPGYRTNVTSITSLGIRGFRLSWASNPWGGWNPRLIHLYGEVSAGQHIDRLALWHPTLDERVTPAYFDWGNVPRNSSATRTFRVKNLSETKTANTIRVAMETLTDGSPSVPSQHGFSLDGVSYLPQRTIATLAPGAMSEVFTFRRLTPANAQLGLNAFRMFCEAATWS